MTVILLYKDLHYFFMNTLNKLASFLSYILFPPLFYPNLITSTFLQHTDFSDPLPLLPQQI